VLACREEALFFLDFSLLLSLYQDKESNKHAKGRNKQKEKKNIEWATI
jgi:hypothetical protein